MRIREPLRRWQAGLAASLTFAATEVLVSAGTKLVVICAFLAAAVASATPSIGLTQTNLARGTTFAPPPVDIRVHRETDDYEVELEIKKDNVDFNTGKSVIAPKGQVGWHSHSGIVLVTVTRGEMTLVDAATCTPTVVTKGYSFAESGADVHNVLNESESEDLEWVATSILPQGATGRIDQPRPADCPF